MEWILQALIGLLLLYALLQTGLLWRARRQKARSAPPLHEVLPEGVAPQPRMLLYFYSEHCGACRRVTPLIDELSRARDGVVKVDVRRYRDSARRFGIMVTPSLVVIDNGRIELVHEGVISGGKLQQFYGGALHHPGQ
jgi:thioredoxin 1